MIRRTPDGELIIPREDIPLLAGVVTGFNSHLEDGIAKGNIPGSFLSAMRMLEGFGIQVLKVLDVEE